MENNPYSITSNQTGKLKNPVKLLFPTLLLCIALLLPSITSATTYYVSPSGDNSSPGSLSSPFKSIKYAVSKLKAGDILFLREGIYYESVIINVNGITENRIIISGFPGESVIIDGNYSLPGGSVYHYLVMVSGAYVTLSNLTIKRSSGSLLIISGDYSHAINVTGIGSRESGIVSSGNHNLLDDCTMTDNGNGYGINGQSTWGSAICTIGQNCTIQNCISYNNKGEGFNAYATADNCIIQDCISYDNGTNIYIDSSTGIILRRNLIYCTNIPTWGIDIGGETGNPSNITIINNICMGNKYNLVIDSNVETINNLIIANNTFVNSTSYNILFINNLITFTNSIFKNNIIYQEESSTTILIPSSHSGFVFSNNCWNSAPQTAAAGAGDVIADPKLAKTGELGAGKLTVEYFKLLPNSPNINKGTGITQVIDDILKNMRDATPDIGAHEYCLQIMATNLVVSGQGGISAINQDKGTLQLNTTFSPLNVSNKTVIWSILNGTGRASINSSGLVTAISNGKVTVKATANDGSRVSGSIEITITNQIININNITVSGSGGISAISTDKGTLQLSASVLPVDASDKSVTWSVQNGTGQATISGTGLITAISNGVITAKAIANDGSGVFGILSISISNQVVPLYISSVVENATPSRVEMTYNMVLATVLPAISSFTVIVNSAARAVNSLEISGTKVILTLANPIVSGDIVTVSYSKASINPLQNVTGGQAVTLGSQSVTNNVKAVDPLFVSSSVENATPSSVEITYNRALANIIPVASAFVVLVNSVARTVNSVSISETKVSLTLASPVLYGDIVSLTYTKPASNPLQTQAGGQAATFTAQSVTNRVSAIPVPVFSGAIVENASPTVIELYYSLALTNIIPAVTSFTVKVNSVTKNVIAVTISGSKVLLTLSNGIISEDNVTISYTKPSSNSLQTPSGGMAATIGPQQVTNKVLPNGPVYVSSVIENAAPNTIEITYNEVLNPNAPGVSAFLVLVNGVNMLVTTVSISGKKVILTLESPVLYGDVVTVSYTKPSGNPLQKTTGDPAVSIGPQPVTNNCLKGNINSKEGSFSFYPNPAHEFINIERTESSSEIHLIRIFDYAGRLCLESRFDPFINKIQIPINLRNGIYIVQLISGSVTLSSQKLIVY